MGSGYICRVIFNVLLVKNCFSIKEFLFRGYESMGLLLVMVLKSLFWFLVVVGYGYKLLWLGDIRMWGGCRLFYCCFYISGSRGCWLWF